MPFIGYEILCSVDDPSEPSRSEAIPIPEQAEKLSLEAALGWGGDTDASNKQHPSQVESDNEGSTGTAEPDGTAEIGVNDPGVAMLLMMRRNKGKDRPALPAPLSKAAIKTSTIAAVKSAVRSAFSPGGGLPSSHPYYRSPRVLASSQVQETRSAAREPSKKAGSPDVDDKNNGPPTAQLRYNRPIAHSRNPSDIRYEQQRARSHVIYNYPTRPPNLTERKEVPKSSDRPQLSPRVYIPPPIFSPRRVQSNGALPTQSSLATPRDALTRPRSVASERVTALEGSAAQRLQYLHQPYKSAIPTDQARRDLPHYSEYFGNENGPLRSPIRESFVRSDPLSRRSEDVRGRPYTNRPIYNPCPSKPPRQPATLQSQAAYRESQRDFRTYARNMPVLKRPAPDDDFPQYRSNPPMQHIAPRISAPQDLAERNDTAKRARTDSAESSSSGSGASPPNRMRYIAPPPGNAGTHLVPHTTSVSSQAGSKSSDAAQQRRRSPAFRSPSPANEAIATSLMQSTVSRDNEELCSIISQLTSGSDSRNAVETARTLANVAAQLAKVAESLKESIG